MTTETRERMTETKLAKRIALMETRLTKRIALMETRLTKRIALMETRLIERIALRETRLIKWMVGLAIIGFVAQAGLTIAALTLLYRLLS